MQQGPCFNRLWVEIVLRNVTPRRADNRVKKTCGEYYTILPGHMFRDVPILLERPMLVGIDEEGGKILMPFRKPCYGTSLYAIDSDWLEIAAFREALSQRGRTDGQEHKIPGNSKLKTGKKGREK